MLIAAERITFICGEDQLTSHQSDQRIARNAELDRARREFAAVGFCVLPFAHLTADQGTWGRLSALTEPPECPYDFAESGDVDEPARTAVARFLIDGATAGSIPTPTDLVAAPEVLGSMSHPVLLESIGAVVGERGMVLRRCQSHVMEPGGFIGRHADVDSNPGYRASLVVGLGDAFEGGALRIEARGETFTVALRRATAVVMATDLPHEVERVSRGRRRSLACFFASSPAARELDRGPTP